MRATFAWSPAEKISLLPSFRLVFGAFDVRMCRVFVWRRLILPVPVLLKRLAAPVCVFNLGIVFSISDAEAMAPSVFCRKTGLSFPFQAHQSIQEAESARLAEFMGSEWDPAAWLWQGLQRRSLCNFAKAA